MKTNLRDVIRRHATNPGAAEFLGELTLDCERYRWPVIVDVTRGCNLSCTFCYNSQKVSQEHADPAIFERLASVVLPHAAEIAMGCRHEPLLHPGLIPGLEGMEQARQRTNSPAVFCLLTSGTLIEPALAAALASSGLDHILISVDTTDEATYAAIRPPATWPDLAGRLKTLIGANPRHVAALILMTRATLPYLARTVADLADLGLNQVGISQMVTGPTSARDDMVRFTGREGELAVGALEEVRSLARRRGIELAAPAPPPASLEGEVFPLEGAGQIQDEHLLARSRRAVCAAPWSKLRIDHEGYAYPCQHMLNRRDAWGNILADSFDAIVNGARAQETRAGLLAGRAPWPVCARCVFGPGDPATGGTG